MYEHRQTGWVVILFFSAVLAFIYYTTPERAWESNFFIIGMILPVIAGLLFSSLKVEEQSDHLKISFGPGVIWKSFRYADIFACKIVRTRWWNGYGIRMLPGGWLFSVSGTQAVELQMENGKIYQIGTDEPEALMQAAQRHLEQNKNFLNHR